MVLKPGGLLRKEIQRKSNFADWRIIYRVTSFQVGLAVDDIQGVQKMAVFNRMKMQVRIY